MAQSHTMEAQWDRAVPGKRHPRGGTELSLRPDQTHPARKSQLTFPRTKLPPKQTQMEADTSHGSCHPCSLFSSLFSPHGSSPPGTENLLSFQIPSTRKSYHRSDMTFSCSQPRHFLLTAPTFTLELYVLYMTVKNNHSICSGVLGTKLCIGKAIREQNKAVVHAANGQSTTIFHQDNLQPA